MMIGTMISHAVAASPRAMAAVRLSGALLADTLSNPTACLPPGFAGPVGKVLGWIKALGLVVALIAIFRIGQHLLNTQGDGVPDRDDTGGKLFNWMTGMFMISGGVSFMSALGLSITTGC